ncbi:MAG: 50S ribosomal protein L18 [Candidatus Uhrbacteria bacterium]
MHRFESTIQNRERRHRRVRARISGTAERPRLSVFRSAKHIAAQVVDDVARRTIAAASDRDIIPSVDAKDQPAFGGSVVGGKVALAREVGKLVAERARAKGVTCVVFDRGGYTYHGRVGAVADGAREGGLKL